MAGLKTTRVWLVLLGLAFCSSLFAHALDAQATTCDSALTQAALNECAEAQAQVAMETLDKLLVDLKSTLSAKSSRELEEAEALWKQSRDVTCRWETSLFETGSVAPMIHANCVRDLTWNRIDHLKILLCEGRGMTGPCEASRRYDRPR